VSGFTVRLENHVDPAAWRDLVAGDPASTFFHDPVWMESLAAAYPYYRGGHVAAYDPDGALAGALPIIRSVRYGVVQLLSLPYGTYGGPLARPGASVGGAPGAVVKAALVRGWLAAAARPRVVRGHLVLRGAEDVLPLVASDAARAGARRADESASLLALPERFDVLWEGFDTEVRRRCRKAEKLGVSVREVSDAAGAALLEPVYREQAPGWSHTPYPHGFFAALLAAAPGRARLWAAFHEGTAVAFQLTVEHRGDVLFLLGTSRPEARALEATRPLWVAILEDACRRGLRTANLGANLGSPTLEEYKQGYGARAVSHPTLLVEKAWFRPLHRLQYRARGLRPV
jgi:hypothetical protein